MQFGPLSHFRLAELDSALEPRLVRLFAAHEGSKITHFECLRKVVVVVESTESLGFQLEKLKVKPFGAGEAIPLCARDVLGHETLVGSVNSKCNQCVYKGGFTFDSRS